MSRQRVISEAILKMRAEALAKQDGNHSTPNSPTPPPIQELLPPPKPIIVEAIAFTGATVITKSEFNEDLLNIFRSIRGRAYRGASENMIPISEWKSFTSQVEALPGGVVIIDKTIAKDLEWHVNAPTWHISLTQRWIFCKFGPRAIQTPMYSVSGAEYRREEKMWRVPIGEGWRLFKVLEDVEGVVYDEDVQALIVEQVSARAKLDKIAKMERGEKYLEYDFNGVAKLRPFQE